MDFSKKTVLKICWIYGAIVGLANFIGYLLPGTSNVPLDSSVDMTLWLSFLDRNNTFMTVISVLSFAIPVFCCYGYVKSAGKNLEKRIVNLPLAYSLFGSMGWILSFLIEVVTLMVVKFRYKIFIYQIVMTSFMYLIQEGLFIFALAFLILDTIHRHYFLPKYYPQGKLSKINGLKNPSIRLLFLIFYISIVFFPIFFLTSTIINLGNLNNIPINKSVFILILFILIFGITLLVIFTGTFSEPLKKLKSTANEIQKGNYDVRCNVVSNDAFGELSDTVNDMIVSLNEKTKKIYAIQDSIIRGMAVMVESRDNSTGGHINRTSDCVKVFVKKLQLTEKYKNLPDSFFKNVIKAAPMHDLGKIAVDDGVLRKPGKFTDEEYEKMKSHSAEGARIVEQVLKEADDSEFKKIAINVAHYHHEKWNGSGYPEKISGEQIPLEARIMALADVFDALVSKRCYKDSFSYEKAFSIIEESLGSHFDPELGKLFLESKKDLMELYDRY
ncbi:MAG: HD domain-containing protein [Treponema sp.]|nr:HD domain-containing protein [Treponema sp.]